MLSRQLVWRVLLVLAVLAGSAALGVSRPIRLGLDLRGGTQIVFETGGGPEETVADDTVSRTLEVLRRRVDQLGVTEPSLQRSGDRRIIVELPGVTNPEEALKVIGRTAQLTFHAVEGLATRAGSDGQAPRVLPDEGGTRLRLAKPVLTGNGVGSAEAIVDSQIGPAWQVSISFRDEGGEQWASVTGEAACAPVGAPQRRIAIVLDDEIISSPEVDPSIRCDEGIGGGDTVITGDFSQKEAKDLALLIRAGALPVPIEVVEQRTIGPTLGEAAIDSSVSAALIGGLLTIAYVIAYYRLLGVLATVALLAYGLISFAVLLALRATLTLPGIAGFVLAIGMAVDANVLVFERSKEEFGAGKSLRSATLSGFKKALSAIADSNATTVLAAIILFYFGTGAVRGFGITLTVGVAVSMFTALVVTRVLVEIVLRNRRIASHPRAFGMNVGAKLRRRLQENPVDLMSRSKIWFGVSAGVLALALTGLFTRGLTYGLEFTGGRLIEYSTSGNADLDRIRSELASAGLPRVVVQASGDGNISVRGGELSDVEEQAVHKAVETAAGNARPIRDEFIGPTIGDELRRMAIIALSLGLGAQLLYLGVRFRWTYASAAVAAMFHDLLILLGVFGWLGKEVDGVFIAALLTVIGYSINDSVVVFDRIREQRQHRSREPLGRIANDAALQTVPRTINTGLGALFILITLYLFGGETLTDFALALIIGILVGTYSSVFTAAPLVVALDRLAPTRDQARQTARHVNRTPTGKRSKPIAASVKGVSRAKSLKGMSSVKRRRRSKR